MTDFKFRHKLTHAIPDDVDESLLSKLLNGIPLDSKETDTNPCSLVIDGHIGFKLKHSCMFLGPYYSLSRSYFQYHSAPTYQGRGPHHWTNKLTGIGLSPVDGIESYEIYFFLPDFHI